MQSVERKQAVTMGLITLAIVGATSLVTALATYFVVKPSATNVNSGATAEIRNDVNIEENISRESDLLSIFGVIMLSVIGLVKIVELTIYFVNRCKQSIKKKYESRATATQQPTASISSSAV